MKIYLAGTSVSMPIQEIQLQELFKKGSKLHSFFHCVSGFEKNWFEVNMKNKVDLFLDSGAFSAWTQGIQINIQDYINFIKEYKDCITVYANLDVIGDPKATWKNQLIMEEAGLNPLPVFHKNEPTEYLLKYLEKYDYIALGGMVATQDLLPWLDTMFSNYLTNPDGMPKVKVHGFGLTSLRLLLRYPWWSVDSTSWVVTGRLGSIYIPRYRNGKWIYDENSWKVSVSSRSPNLKEAGQHINTFSPRQKQVFLDYIHDKGYKLGKSSFKKESQTYQLKENERWAEKKPKDKTTFRDVEILEEVGISNKYQLRDEMNIIYFLDLEKTMVPWPWAFKERTNKGFGI